MKHPVLRAAAALGAAALLAAPALAQFEAPRPSPKSTVTQRIGLTDFTVTYSRPGAKGREVWGTVVPWDKPWRTGANEATTVKISDDVWVEGQKLAAGTYSLVTIPGKESWTFAFNSDLDLFSRTEYAEAKDVLRVKAKPGKSDVGESLQISFQNLKVSSGSVTPASVPDSGELAVEWAGVRAAVSFKVEVKEKALKSARAAVANAKPDDADTPLAVARWFLAEKNATDEAMKIVERSLTIKKTYGALATRARLLAEAGKSADAVKAGEEAVAFGKAQADKPNTEPLEKQIAEWKAKK